VVLRYESKFTPPNANFEWRFTLDSGQFHINGLPFDANRVDHVVLKGSMEEWTLRNDVLAGNWVHPVHIHFEEGRILERTTRPDPVNQPDLHVPVNLQQVQGVGLNTDEDPNNARRDVYPPPGQHIHNPAAHLLGRPPQVARREAEGEQGHQGKDQ